MNVRDAQNLRNKLFIIGGLIMLSGYLYSPLMIIGIVVMFSGLIPHFRYNKCPIAASSWAGTKRITASSAAERSTSDQTFLCGETAAPH